MGGAEQEYARFNEYNDQIVTHSSRLAFEVGTFQGRAGTREPSSAIGNVVPIVSSKVKLPKVKLLKFNGHHQQWRPSWEQFEQVIHGKSELSSADKFHCLRSALSGEAATAIAGLPPTASCYEDVS